MSTAAKLPYQPHHNSDERIAHAHFPCIPSSNTWLWVGRLETHSRRRPLGLSSNAVQPNLSYPAAPEHTVSTSTHSGLRASTSLTPATGIGGRTPAPDTISRPPVANVDAAKPAVELLHYGWQEPRLSTLQPGFGVGDHLVYEQFGYTLVVIVPRSALAVGRSTVFPVCACVHMRR
ncbi:hypothetical protein HMN09_00864500 [Mycena chlorophos]|uniref:Uncharacterized protein n=1 Tax=Mycena chlorophos TaxID=658473 RepID=A0A8H6W291_MYCCL|nr:hypothetical protein HMN09_00864500 [Mycena chlorophos]